jgi:ribonucleoside-diphosphate reductase alpha chain
MLKTRKVDCKIVDDQTGEVIFQKDSFEVPEGWSDRAATIMASRYAMDEEFSAIEIIKRVVFQISLWGHEQGHLTDDFVGVLETGEATLEKNGEPVTYYEKFIDDLIDILINQRASFNSPVWFNCGVKENNNQMSACFILPVEDNMESILQYNHDIGMIFKGGSGCGTNISRLRAKGEPLSNRGYSSGPVSFMRVWDATGSCVKSGGKTRRAASMVCMDTDHPDIVEFIECKADEERKAKILIAQGISPEEAYATVRFQNANHSIRVTDDFMQLAKKQKEIDDDPGREMLKGFGWRLINRGDSTIAAQMNASRILRRTAEIAWETGDPGIQFHDRMNKDNPVPSMGEIRSTNPCSEFSAIDNSSCNLASLNLVKYFDGEDLDHDLFEDDIETIITAMDILIEAADYPTQEIRETTIATRPLGLGFTNLGACLMLMGLPYDSPEARKTASFITREMTSVAYRRSTELAEKLGPFEAFKDNEEQCIQIAKRLVHADHDKYAEGTEERIRKRGLRNSQLTLLAPTGTISWIMDADTTGIEPLYALKSIKTLAGGGTMEIVPGCVEQAVNNLQEADVWDGTTAINLVIPLLPKEEQAIFKTADEIHWKDHILMMAACQKHLNGAISKTINMPADCTVEDIEEAYIMAWKEGLKSLAVYRYGSKDMQPLKAADSPDHKMGMKLPEAFEEINEEPSDESWSAIRKRLPDERHSVTHKFIVASHEGYITAGMYDDGNLGEVFIRMAKEGSTIAGLMDSFATSISIALQYGVPLSVLVDKFSDMRFEPAGITSNPDIRFAKSIIDYIARWLGEKFLDDDEEEVVQPALMLSGKMTLDGPPCPHCMTIMQRSGTCFVCPQCSETTGCS